MRTATTILQAELLAELRRKLLEKDSCIWHLKHRVEDLERRDRDIEQVITALQREHTTRLNRFERFDSQEMKAKLEKANQVIEYLNDQLRHALAGDGDPNGKPGDTVERGVRETVERLRRNGS